MGEGDPESLEGDLPHDMDIHIDPPAAKNSYLRDTLFLAFLGLLVALMVFAEIIGILFGILIGAVIGFLAILPGALWSYFLYFRNSTHLLPIRAWLTVVCPYALMAYFGAMFWEMAQLMAWYNVLKVIVFPTNQPKVIAFSWFAAFFCPALVEELSKFFIAVSIPVIVPGSTYYGVMLVGFSGACAIATIENYQYAVLQGLVTGDAVQSLVMVIIRMFMSVPLHCITGILIGSGVALAAFDPNTTVWKRIGHILAVPVILHGTFDFALFLLEQESTISNSGLWYLLLLVPLVTVCVGFALALMAISKCNALDLQQSHSMNLEDEIEISDISAQHKNVVMMNEHDDTDNPTVHNYIPDNNEGYELDELN